MKEHIPEKKITNVLLKAVVIKLLHLVMLLGIVEENMKTIHQHIGFIAGINLNHVL